MQRLCESPSVYYLKWINCLTEKLDDGEFSRVDHVLIYCTNKSNQVTGFTFLEPKQFSSDIVARLTNRIASSNDGDIYKILAPKFLRGRIESLIARESESRLDVQYTSFFSIISLGGQVRVKSKARVVCVDDSLVLLKLLKRSVEDAGSFEVVKQISDPKVAVESILQIRPDLVTMDIQMPGKSGVDVVRELVPKSKVPILMISSLTAEDGGLVFQALNSGAFDYLQKPSHDGHEEFVEELTEMALAALSKNSLRARSLAVSASPVVKDESMSFSKDLFWLIGSSTGGTQALTQILTRLPKHIPPLLIVQHIPPVFSKSFAESLDAVCPFTVKEAEDGDLLRESHVYVAPGGKQMALKKHGTRFFIEINDDWPVNRFKPSVDYLLNSVAALKHSQIVAGILTGMGRDGAVGLLELRKGGARTFAQDEATSAVFGMPRAAIELGAAQDVLSLDRVSDFLVRESLAFKRAG